MTEFNTSNISARWPIYQCGDQWPPVRKTGSFSGFGGETCINSGRVRKFTKSRYYHNMIINLSCWKIKKILTVSFLWKRFRSVFFSRVGTTSRSPYMSSIHRLFCCPYTSVYYYDKSYPIHYLRSKVIHFRSHQINNGPSGARKGQKTVGETAAQWEDKGVTGARTSH